MTSKSDKELQKEIAYLTKLIDNHKKTSPTECKPVSKPPGRANKFKWTANTPQQNASSHSTAPCTAQKVSARTTTANSGPGSRTVLPRKHTPTSKPASNAHIHRYADRHHHGNPNNRPGNQRCTNRKWSGTVRSPLIGKETDSKSVSKPAKTSTLQSASTAIVTAEEEKSEKKRSPSTVCSEVSRTMQTSDHQQKATTPPPVVTSKEVSTPTSSRWSQFHTIYRRVGTGSGSKYKWRRRSTPSSPLSRKSVKSSVLKSPTTLRARPHTPSWVVHNRYKLTRASIVHKYNRIMQRQHSNRLNRSMTRRPSANTALKISRPKCRNKVWCASTPKTHSSGNAAQSSTPLPATLSGRELKTRQGNRQWVSKRLKQSSSPRMRLSSVLRGRAASQKVFAASPFIPGPRRRLSGHESKTRHGNRQWISKHVARRSLQSATVNYSRGGRVAVHRRKVSRGQHGLHNTQLVSLSGGQKFVVDSGRRRMKRLSLSALTSSSLLVRPRSHSRGKTESHNSTSVKQYLASRAVQRSRVYVWSAKQRKKKEAKQYCIFYNRFGKCNRGDACPYIHDPSKIAICTKFLRGICDKTDGSCLFSHTMSKDKMPTCSYFLRGVCTRKVCPYLHPSVGRRAEVCLDFARGYCPNGEKCNKQHVIDCPTYTEKGACPHGDKCLLRHRKANTKATVTGRRPVAPTKTPLAFKRLRRKAGLEVGYGSRQAEAVGDSPRDEDDRSSDDSTNDKQLRYSPLDPNFPAPDFLAL